MTCIVSLRSANPVLSINAKINCREEKYGAELGRADAVSR